MVWICQGIYAITAHSSVQNLMEKIICRLGDQLGQAIDMLNREFELVGLAIYSTKEIKPQWIVYFCRTYVGAVILIIIYLPLKLLHFHSF